MLSMSDEKNNNNEELKNEALNVENQEEKSMVEKAIDKVKDVIEDVKEAAEDFAEKVEDVVEDIEDKVEDVIENITGDDDDDDDDDDSDDDDSDDNDNDNDDDSDSDDEDEEEEEDDDELVAGSGEEASSSSHDDFNWGMGKRNTTSYTEDEKAKYLEDYETSLSSVNQFEIIGGKVTAINDGDVVLDLNFKSDGLVSLSEFRDIPDLSVGDIVDVYVEEQEDKRGQLVLSRRKAKLIRAWETIKSAHETGAVIKGVVISKTKGGLIVDTHGLETFLPGSQIDIKPIVDYDSYVGKTMEFKVVKINESIKNAVVSHKALIESDLEEQRQAIISSLEQGQVLEGVVKNITDFGAFLDLGGVDGLLYITDISWGRISHPSEVLKLNQKINVVVLDFDDNKKRISLGLKQLQPHPWEVLGEQLSEGSDVEGKIVNIEDYGAFLEIQPGVEGLIHVSEVTVGSRKDVFEFETIAPDPWVKSKKYPVGKSAYWQNQKPYTLRSIRRVGRRYWRYGSYL